MSFHLCFPSKLTCERKLLKTCGLPSKHVWQAFNSDQSEVPENWTCMTAGVQLVCHTFSSLSVWLAKISHDNTLNHPIRYIISFSYFRSSLGLSVDDFVEDEAPSCPAETEVGRLSYFTVFTLIVNWSNLKMLVHESALHMCPIFDSNGCEGQYLLLGCDFFLKFIVKFSIYLWKVMTNQRVAFQSHDCTPL